MEEKMTPLKRAFTDAAIGFTGSLIGVGIFCAAVGDFSMLPAAVIFTTIARGIAGYDYQGKLNKKDEKISELEERLASAELELENLPQEEKKPSLSYNGPDMK